jgi:hypothetical protein
MGVVMKNLLKKADKYPIVQDYLKDIKLSLTCKTYEGRFNAKTRAAKALNIMNAKAQNLAFSLANEIR